MYSLNVKRQRQEAVQAAEKEIGVQQRLRIKREGLSEAARQRTALWLQSLEIDECKVITEGARKASHTIVTKDEENN